ncbi:hypothetical protein MRB53_040610 [Persea americana]|nr:hypothetical protein MRB53_040610 [Persea americana]
MRYEVTNLLCTVRHSTCFRQYISACVMIDDPPRWCIQHGRSEHERLVSASHKRVPDAATTDGSDIGQSWSILANSKSEITCTAIGRGRLLGRREPRTIEEIKRHASFYVTRDVRMQIIPKLYAFYEEFMLEAPQTLDICGLSLPIALHLPPSSHGSSAPGPRWASWKRTAATRWPDAMPSSMLPSTAMQSHLRGDVSSVTDSSNWNWQLPAISKFSLFAVIVMNPQHFCNPQRSPLLCIVALSRRLSKHAPVLSANRALLLIDFPACLRTLPIQAKRNDTPARWSRLGSLIELFRVAGTVFWLSTSTHDDIAPPSGGSVGHDFAATDFQSRKLRHNDVELDRALEASIPDTLTTALRSRLISTVYACAPSTNLLYHVASLLAPHGFQYHAIADCMATEQTVSATSPPLTTIAWTSIDQVHVDISTSLRQDVSSGTLARLRPTTPPPSREDTIAATSSTDIRACKRSRQADCDACHDRIYESAAKRRMLRKSPEAHEARHGSVQDESRSKKALAKAGIGQHIRRGAGDYIGEGDSRLVLGIDHRIADPDVFQRLKDEVHWQKMYHASGEVPRLVCAQGAIDADGTMPVYRHPADETLPLLHFSPAVLDIKDYVEQVVGHPVNHVLIQLYRTGQDFISEHSDKTLDIVRGSSIANVSIGAERTMRLRTKKSRAPDDPFKGNSERVTQVIPMPHGSTFVLGPLTNQRWLHGINADKRLTRERTEAELAFGGERISLTFRRIGTFLSRRSMSTSDEAHMETIWGQGATSQAKEDAKAVISGVPAAKSALLVAFSNENQSSHLDWHQIYGPGSDVLHLSAASASDGVMLFLSGNRAADLPVIIFACELRLSVKMAGITAEDAGITSTPRLCFRDDDPGRTQVYDIVPILLYLDRCYGNRLRSATTRPTSDSVTVSTHGESNRPLLASAFELVLRASAYTASPLGGASLDYSSALDDLERRLSRSSYLAGDSFSAADCIWWPIVEDLGDEALSVRGALAEWFDRVGARPSVHDSVWKDAKE